MILRDVTRAQLNAGAIGLTIFGKLRGTVAAGARELRMVEAGTAYLNGLAFAANAAQKAIDKATTALAGGERADLELDGEPMRVLLLALFLYQTELAKAAKKFLAVGIAWTTEGKARGKAVHEFIVHLSAELEDQFPLLLVEPLDPDASEAPDDAPQLTVTLTDGPGGTTEVSIDGQAPAGPKLVEDGPPDA